MLKRGSVRPSCPGAAAAPVLRRQCCCLCRGLASAVLRTTSRPTASKCRSSRPGSQAREIGWQGAFYNLAKLVATGGLVWLAGPLSNGVSASARLLTTPLFGRGRWFCCVLCAALVALAVHAQPCQLPSGGSAASEGRRCRKALSAKGGDRRFLHEETHLVLYRLHRPVQTGRGPRDEDRASLFLKADTAAGGLGLTNQQIGLYYGTFGAGAFLLGFAAGGLTRSPNVD